MLCLEQFRATEGSVGVRGTSGIRRERQLCHAAQSRCQSHCQGAAVPVLLSCPEPQQSTAAGPGVSAPLTGPAERGLGRFSRATQKNPVLTDLQPRDVVKPYCNVL